MHALPLVIPEIRRLKSLTIDAPTLPSGLEYFRRNAPLLQRLDIKIATNRRPDLDGALFCGDISSLRELRLQGVVTHLPWKNLANLQVVELKPYSHRYGMTQLLDFFESAPLLHTVSLWCTMPGSSDAPPKRRVPLCHLKDFHIKTNSSPSTLLHHFHIPPGASVISDFYYDGDGPPFLDHLPESSPDFHNLSHATAVNLRFDPNRMLVRLSGPSGSLHVLVTRIPWGVAPPYTRDSQIFHSLGHSMLSTIQSLTISNYQFPKPAQVEECPVFQALSSTNNLRALTLIDCNHLLFVHALDPEQHPSNFVLCPDMEQLNLHVRRRRRFDLRHVIEMAKNRASRGARLPSVTCANQDGSLAKKQMFELKQHVTHGRYQIGRLPPAWDDVPNMSCGEGE